MKQSICYNFIRNLVLALVVGCSAKTSGSDLYANSHTGNGFIRARCHTQ